MGLRFGSCVTILAIPLALAYGCGGGNSEPTDAETISNADLALSLSEAAVDRAASEMREVNDAFAERGVFSDLTAEPGSRRTCTGEGDQRRCDIELIYSGTSRNTAEFGPFMTGAVVYEVVVRENGCWRARNAESEIRNLEAEQELREIEQLLGEEGLADEAASRRSGHSAFFPDVNGCIGRESAADVGQSDKGSAEPPASDPEPGTDVVPGRSIGPVSLGDSLEEVEAALGPGHQEDRLSPNYDFDVIGGTLNVVFDDDRGVIVVSTDSRQFSVEGATSAMGLDEVSRALPGWETEACPDGESGEVRLRESPEGPITVFEFQAPPVGSGVHARVYIAADDHGWSVCRGE